MKQQTAVEWIINELRQLAFNKEQHLGMGDIRLTQGHIDELEEQAKQMEKEQILDAICANQNGLLRRNTILEAKQYYNETYGGQGSPDTTSPNTQNK